MVYIDSEFYTETFKGREIPASDFDRLAEAASEAIYAVCRMKPDETMILNEDYLVVVSNCAYRIFDFTNQFLQKHLSPIYRADH